MQHFVTHNTTINETVVVLPEAVIDLIGEQPVLNMGFEKSLCLYNAATWKKITSNLMQLDHFDPINRKFIRMFSNTAIALSVNQKSIAIPTKLTEFAGIKKHLILLVHENGLQIFDRDFYENNHDHIYDNIGTVSRFLGQPINIVN
ncbi:hypothetical protein [Pedobacter heparinus]|uniref:hypothetical protein n=1 Tax=Pedobacter heparinus TaxID=984 RepID=UPI002930D09A|nr:hypothetical protein [Pedobacter heparinus]